MTGDLGITILGAGDSQGVPRWYCACDICREARATGVNQRSRPAALLTWNNRRILLDAPPELRLQLIREGITELDAVCITHAHNDHIAGMVDLYDFVRWTNRQIPVYVPAASLATVAGRFPFLAHQSRLLWQPLHGPTELHGIRVIPFEVPHGFNGDAHAFRLEVAGKAAAYVPDALDIPADVLDAYLRDLDLLILGTAFFHEDHPRERRSIYDVGEALAVTARLRPRQTVFTHLGHGVDCRQKLPEHHSFAFDGMTLTL